MKKVAERKEAVTKKQVVKKSVVKVSAAAASSSSSSSASSFRSLSELHTLRLRLEAAEGTLSQYIHICFGDDGAHDCGLKITQLEVDKKN